jgi:long-chain fatty acid transport protein
MKFMRGRAVARGRSLLLFGTTAAAALTPLQPLAASGFYLQEQSVRGWGRANSGEAADQGPDSLWWNPASIARGEEGEEEAGLAVTFGATGIAPSGRIEDSGTQLDRPALAPGPVGGSGLQRNPVPKGVLPNSAMAARLSDRLAIGLAIASPYSFGTEYDSAGWQRYSAIETKLLTFDIQPSIAFAPTDWLSLGAALNVEYADASLENALPNLAPGSADGRLRLTGKGWDLGWSAGAQIRPAPRVTLGLAWKSAIRHDLSGTFEISGLAGPLAVRNASGDVSANLTTPSQLIVAARAGITPSTTLNVQAVRFGWSKFDQIDLGPPLSSFIPQGYKDSTSLAFGVDQRVGGRLTLRAGLQLDPTPTRDDRRDARVPDADRMNYNVGGSFRMGRRLRLDFAAAYTRFDDAPITRDERFYANTPAEVQVLTEGRATRQRAITLALGGRIGF